MQGAEASARQVARVIYNRIAQNMPLGIDSTLRYGLRIPPDKAILQSQLDKRPPVQQRATRTGLPPTPIANPGKASLQAAAKPANNQFLYYARTKDCQTHFFSKTQEEHDDVHGNGPNSFLNGPRPMQLEAGASEPIEGTTRVIVGIIGSPVSHSLSPRMHNAAFASLGLDFVVRAVPCRGCTAGR